jgi:hypothetical protein
MRIPGRVAVITCSAAIMLISQANPGWDDSDGTRAPRRNPTTLVQTDGQPDGFRDFLLALRAEVVRFRRPVVYVHGDSHYFRIDSPFLDAQGRRFENFTRLETFGNNPNNGNNDVRWVKVNVDARTREVFSFLSQIVPGNRVARPRAVAVERYTCRHRPCASMAGCRTRSRARQPRSFCSTWAMRSTLPAFVH